MDLYEKIGYFVLGMLIGYVLGHIVSTLRDVKEELDEVDDIVKKRDSNEGGFMRFPIVADIAVILALGLTFWAAVTTGHTNSELQSTQDDLATAQSDIQDLSECNKKFLGVVITTLNGRTTYTQQRADANTELQKAQSKFLKTLLIKPPVSDEEARDALVEYSMLLNDFVEASEDAKANVQEFPYPTDEELEKCYSDAKESSK